MRKVLIGRAHPSSEIRTDAEDEYLEDDEIDTHVACNAIESGDEFREGTDEAAGNNDADDDEFLDKMTERQSNKKRLTLKPTKPRAKLDYTRYLGLFILHEPSNRLMMHDRPLTLEFCIIESWEKMAFPCCLKDMHN